MSLNPLDPAHSNGDVIDASHINEITLALMGAFVGRNSTGIPTPYQSLGTALVPWGSLFARQLVIDGKILDPAEITSKATRLISGRTRTTSAKSDFLRASGSALSFTILANDEPLTLSINDTPVLITEDIIVTGLTAAPASNNLADVHEVTFPNESNAGTGMIYIGEDDDYIEFDALGSNVTAKIGQMVCFKHTFTDMSITTIEYLYGFLESATKLKNVFRGFYFDSAGNPVHRSNFIGNDSQLALMSLGWVFMDINGVTVEVSYKTPVYSETAPTAPAAADYWFDLETSLWNRYSGSAWIPISRILLGMVVSDASACVATRSLDFDLRYNEENTIDLIIGGEYILNSRRGINRISVNAEEFEFNTKPISIDLEKVIIEMPTPTNPNDLFLKDVYIYMKETGQIIGTLIKPYDRRDDLLGYYHPYESWRCIGRCYITQDPANSELGILSMTNSYLYNPSVLPPYSELAFTKAVNVSGGGLTLGNNDIVFNEINNTEGALNVVETLTGIQAIEFGRGQYKIELEAQGFEVDNHRVGLVDFIHGEVITIGPMSTAPTTIQSNAKLTTVINVRSIAVRPTPIHQASAGNAINGAGKQMNAIFKEIYAGFRITRIK